MSVEDLLKLLAPGIVTEILEGLGVVVPMKTWNLNAVADKPVCKVQSELVQGVAPAKQGPNPSSG